MSCLENQHCLSLLDFFLASVFAASKVVLIFVLCPCLIASVVLPTPGPLVMSSDQLKVSPV